MLKKSLSKHTICKLKEVIKIVKIITQEFIVEKFIECNFCRVAIMSGKGKVTACYLREKPNVIDDNKHTIKELIEINKKPKSN